ncbi:MAG: long-chain fatty acid--CoA ligase [Bradymonadaceae bacterium]
MDVNDYLDVRPAPAAIFEWLDERASRPRFMTRTDGDGWHAVTWGEFADRVRNVALYADELGLGEGDCAAIFAPNSVAWLAAAYGVQTAGAAFVPIYPSSTAEQARYAVEKTQPDLVFAESEEIFPRVAAEWEAYGSATRVVDLGGGTLPWEAFAETYGADGPWKSLDERLLPWDRLQRLGAQLAEARPERLDTMLDSLDLDSTAQILFTSGTTGEPKGVPLTHRNVGSNGSDWVEVNGPHVDEHPVDLCWLPFSHLFGFGEISLGNTLGFTTYLADPSNVLDLMPEVAPSVFMSIPRYWEKIAQRAMEGETNRERAQLLDEVTGGELAFCLSGGAGLKREIKEFFLDHSLFITEGYGLTEASPTLTMNRPDDHDFDSVGKPFPSVDVRLADDGEIQAKGPNVFEGYLDNPEATEEAFTEDGWLKTGDLREWTDDGHLKVVGRKKEILVTAGGKNISPAHIENKVDDDPVIEHLVVYGDGKKYLTAGIWVDDEAVEERLADRQGLDDTRELVDERIADLNDDLPSYETLKDYALFDEPLSVDNGTLTPTMKVKRNEVYDRFGDRLEALYE